MFAQTRAESVSHAAKRIFKETTQSYQDLNR